MRVQNIISAALSLAVLPVSQAAALPAAGEQQWTLSPGKYPRKHTNGNGFWFDVGIFHKTGLNIGFNPTGRSIRLGDATSQIVNRDAIALQCKGIFGWDDLDGNQSGWNYWSGFNPQLY
ncbi:hypothetical protein NQ176_g1267 [Zarea fungicola]|uniref:Uncharacterized protein n=1 Tax=Zarea fungicola TaxID=93591 RepID=A0ACC1NTF9_9HYPO|nr:hypothetical protein NQ176_g1267 [Lecanicillium fungicola]